MIKRKWQLFLLSLVSIFLFSTTALAFTDIKGKEYEEQILTLKNRGIIHGIGNDLFKPERALTNAEAIQLLVNAYELSLAHFTFMEQPKATDYFSNTPNDQWYSEAFVIAHLNNLPIPKDIKPNDPITKELFAHLVFQGLTQKGNFTFIELWKIIEDEDKINKDYMNSIQKLLVTNIMELDNGAFHPKESIKRGEAASVILKALRFLDDQNRQIESPPLPKAPALHHS